MSERQAVPGYWMYETSGVLRPVVQAYLEGATLSGAQVVVIRSYLRQWIAGPWMPGANLDRLRARIDFIETHADVASWLRDAEAVGIDPL